MEIKIEKLSDELEEEWKNLKNSQVFQRPEWTKFLSLSTVITARDKNGKLIGVMPLKERKIGIFKLVVAPSVPLVEAEQKEVFINILNFFKGMGGIKLIETTYNDFNNEIDYQSLGFSILKKGTQIIPLDQPLEYVWANLAGEEGKNHKKIKKAVKIGVEVSEANSKEQWDEFYQIYLDAGKEWVVPIMSKEEYGSLRENVGNSNLAKLFVSKLNGEIIDGLVTLLSNDNVVTFISASKKGKENLQGYSLILWNILKYAWLKGFKNTDFYGIDIYAKPGEKTYRITEFKKSFGGHTQIFGRLSNSRLLRKAYDIYNNQRWLKLLYSKLKTHLKTLS